MDTASPQPGSLVLPLSASQADAGVLVLPPSASIASLSSGILEEWFLEADCKACGLTLEEFGDTLARIGVKCNFCYPASVSPDAGQRESFLRGLRLADLALASACALGRESAWKRFFDLYRAPLTHAATAITRSATLGNDLADSLYAELYGLRERAQADAGAAGGPARHCPLASYSGRGSLLAWLRTTLAQRHIDHHRRTHRETSLDTFDAPAPEPLPAPLPAHLTHLKHAIVRALRSLGPESRFLLSAYFLDQRTLAEIARILHVHEATISRRIKRLSHELRDELLGNLKMGGLSEQAAEEALGIDPRDLEINLRLLLQSSGSSPFPVESPELGANNALADRKKDSVEQSNGGILPPEAGQP